MALHLSLQRKGKKYNDVLGLVHGLRQPPQKKKDRSTQAAMDVVRKSYQK
jgi:hypothetical protein